MWPLMGKEKHFKQEIGVTTFGCELIEQKAALSNEECRVVVYHVLVTKYFWKNIKILIFPLSIVHPHRA